MYASSNIAGVNKPNAKKVDITIPDILFHTTPSHIPVLQTLKVEIGNTHTPGSEIPTTPATGISKTNKTALDILGIKTIGIKNITTEFHSAEVPGGQNTDVHNHISAIVIVQCNTPGKQLNALITQVICPEECLFQDGEVWGNDVYKEDSSICRAAINAGKLTNTGGALIVEKRPGQSSYQASTRNGVTTQSYGSWTRSFVLTTPSDSEYSFNIRGINIPTADVRGAHNPGLQIPNVHGPYRVIPESHLFDRQVSNRRVSDFEIVIVHCDTPGKQLPGPVTHVFCPVGCLSLDSKVWGDGIYTDDSSICRAAIHDGKLTNDGGLMTVEKMPGHSSYNESTKNGMITFPFDAWSLSFQLKLPPRKICHLLPFLTINPNSTKTNALKISAATSNTSKMSLGPLVSIGCSTPALKLLQEVNRVKCPSGCISKNAPVWGTNIYTDGSSICKAAIHAGRILNTGGIVTVEKTTRPEDGFLGSIRNGVTSSHHKTWKGAFILR